MKPLPRIPTRRTPRPWWVEYIALPLIGGGLLALLVLCLLAVPT